MSKAILTMAVYRGKALLRRESLHEPVTSDVCTYSLIKSGPDVNPKEVELPNSTAIEVMVLWGNNVLHVAHVMPHNGFTVGETSVGQRPCDFFIPEEVLGAPRMTLVVSDGMSSSIVIPPRATGYFEASSEPRMSLDAARRLGTPSTALPGGCELELKSNSRAQIQLGDFTFQFACVNAGRPCKKGLAAGVETEVFSFFGLSLAAVGSFVTAMAFLVPPQNGMEDESFNSDQVYVIQQYLKASAEREDEAKQTEQSANVDANNKEGGTGTRAKNEEGSMGNPNSRVKSGRFGIQGPRDNPDPHLSRLAALAEARSFGMVGILNSGRAGDPNAPTAPWGREESLGQDDLSARGNMWGDNINEAFGAGGLGLVGLGEGGGGRGEGIGLGTINTIGHGSGTGPGQGFGAGNGGLGHGVHKTRVPVMHPGQTIISGRLPPEVIQRIVRQNYGRFRNCYEQGLSRNPNLEGRVQVRFVIGRDGTVSNVQKGDSDLPDGGVVSCVVSAYYGLNFPQPDGGIVTVVYPIMFQPG
jgi:hypothetical protein